jgi:hypothetical protein
MADDEGRYFFADLPAGEFYLRATKEGYAPAEHGQRRAWGDVALAPLGVGERRTDVTLRMWKYGVISGLVVDEAGEPVVGIAVRALIKTVIAGRTRFGTFQVIPELVPVASTDDRGMFRFAELQPGTYVVLVPSAQSTVPISVMNGMEPFALRTELFWAGVTETPALGQPRTQQTGDVAMLTMSSGLIPPPVAAGRETTYRTTYYPSAATVAAATEIPIAAGEERTGVTIALQPVPSVRITGRLVAPDGSAPPVMGINLVGEAMTDVLTRGLPVGTNVMDFQTATALSDAAGRFTLAGVPRGTYVIQHASRFLSRTWRQGLPVYWISQPVAVGTDDIEDLVVHLRLALRVEGRVEFRTGGSQAVASPPIVPGVSFETPFGEIGGLGFAVELSRDSTPPTFAGVAAGGRYIVRPYETGPWVVQSVMAGDRDVTDRVFDLQADTSFVVTYTDQRSRVAGVVKDARGAPSETAVVLVFPVERQWWSGHGSSPRHLKDVMTRGGGVYAFDHLPAGEYYLVAVDGAASDGWQDPKTLEALARRATRVTVPAGQASTTVDLIVETTR